MFLEEKDAWQLRKEYPDEYTKGWMGLTNGQNLKDNPYTGEKALAWEWGFVDHWNVVNE